MYLMKGMAALALCAVAVSCNRLEFSGQPEVSKEDAIANAELQLGASIDPNQDWNMIAEATANITVNETFGETYTVKIYANNPLADGVAYVLKQGQIQNGQTFTTNFTYPSGNRSIIVGVTDSKGFTLYRSGKVENGVLNTTFGQTAAAPRRSMAAPACPEINQPYTEAWVADYLTTASEPTASNVTNNDAGASQGISTPVIMPSVQLGSYPGYCQYNPTQVTEADINFYNRTFSPLWTAYQNAPQEYSTYNNEENYVRVNNAKIDKFMAVYDAVVTYAGESGVSNWLNITQMPQKGAYGAGDYVTEFKITTTWNGGISVAGSEGSQNPGCERTIVVTGTWNVTEDQRIGSLGKIIIANGGTVNVASANN